MKTLYWTSKDGTKTKITELKLPHINNIINCYLGKGNYSLKNKDFWLPVLCNERNRRLYSSTRLGKILYADQSEKQKRTTKTWV